MVKIRKDSKGSFFFYKFETFTAYHSSNRQKTKKEEEMKQKIEEQAESLLLDNYEKYYRLAYNYAKNESGFCGIYHTDFYS